MAQFNQGYLATVTIDMRALVDKVLARYSSKFSVFRELLQNSDDAGCNLAELHFQTTSTEVPPLDLDAEALLPNLDTTHVVRWTFKNYGKPFSDQDWHRLPRIALGNPDPHKIGAFGVGFFSVFSVTENPHVTSQDKEMKFWWDESNQLHYRYAILPQTETTGLWTTIEMPLRKSAPMPPIFELMQFLASSITFMVNLESVAVFFDRQKIGYIIRSQGESQLITIPTELRRSSPENIMVVQSVHQYPVTIETKILLSSGHFYETKDITMFTAGVCVKVDPKLSTELERCMKKEPPSHLKFSLAFTDHDQTRVDEQKRRCDFSSSFQGLHANLDEVAHAQIFIGHATTQTTGVGGHMASHFIPTVERESIDLADANVAIWNRDLLHVGGILCRTVYELELSKIQLLWEPASGKPSLCSSQELEDSLNQRFLHVLKFFTFHCSTPSPTVAKLLADSFYGCSTLPLKFLSSVGVCEAPCVREFDPVLCKFLKTIPMLSEYVTREGAQSIAVLPDKHKVPPTTPSDILQDLQCHTLDGEELIAFLRWLIAPERADCLASHKDLLDKATLCNAGRELPMSSISSFIHPSVLGLHIPPAGPLPPSLIPLTISRHFNFKELSTLGWEEFTVALWLQHISDPGVTLADEKYDFTRSVDWAKRVLTTLSRIWPQLPDDVRHESSKVLRNKACIPTSKGLSPPEDSYLPISGDTQVYRLDLPVLSFDPGLEVDVNMERCLLFLGVRKDPPVQFILNQMQYGETWTMHHLITYLAREERLLTDNDISTLKSSRIFMKKRLQGDEEENTSYRADELYPPVDIFLKLRLPVIQWSESWRDTSREAQLLYHLGLNQFPPLSKIVELCSSKETGVQKTAFGYLCRGLDSKYMDYKPEDFRDVEFIPAESNSNACLKRVGEVYSGAQWKVLGFSVVQDQYRDEPLHQLGVEHHPSTSKILDLLEKTPPRDGKTAGYWFEVLSSHISAFSSSERTKLSRLPFVPAPESAPSTTVAPLPPTKCYVDKGFKPPLHAALFVFVDFGDKANDFLHACGLKSQVLIEDVAEALIENPKRFFDLAGGYEGFLAELQNIAYQSRDVSNPTLHKMSHEHSLLGVRRKNDGLAGSHYEYRFLTSQDVTIVDDSDDYQLFSDCLFVAPQGEKLERFYASLGCSYLSAVVQERCDGLHEIQAPEICLKVQSRILERLPLFIQKYSDSKPEAMVPSSPDHLRVKACKSIRVFKTLATKTENVVREREARAFARKDGERIELWISRSAKRDMYEVATSLCRLLFGTNKTNVTLLLEKVLSADLEGLERRGFVVDQISQEYGDGYTVGKKSKRKRSEVRASMTLQLDPQLDFGKPSGNSEIILPSRSTNTADSFKSGETADASYEYSTSPLLSRQILLQSDVRDIVKNILDGSHVEGELTIPGQSRSFQCLSSSFCSMPPKPDILRYAGSIKSIPVYAEQGTEVDTLMQSMDDQLRRFVDIIITLCEVYRIPRKRLRIFYDTSRGCIGFNHDGIIHLNLQYFNLWHDDEVERGVRQNALMWWFLTLAHEMAHDVTKLHNSVHEFWFAAICEAHLATLSQHLRSANAPLRHRVPWLSLVVPFAVLLFAYFAKQLAR